MSLLSRPYGLHDCDDLEALAERALRAQLRSMRAHLGAHDFEDAVAYLVAVCWEASLKFDHERSASFEKYAYALARRRTIDWLRKHRGRSRWVFKDHTYERERPQVFSLTDRDSESQLVGPLGSRMLDFGGSSGSDLARAIERGCSLLARSSSPPSKSAVD
jgi:RNA polymerase sigma factor (sigma-70 family)